MKTTIEHITDWWQIKGGEGAAAWEFTGTTEQLAAHYAFVMQELRDATREVADLKATLKQPLADRWSEPYRYASGKVAWMGKTFYVVDGEIEWARSAIVELQNAKPAHVCGLQGFGHIDDVCPACREEAELRNCNSQKPAENRAGK